MGKTKIRSRRCIVPGCGYRQFSGPNAPISQNKRTLFRFTQNEAKAILWIKQIPELRPEDVKKYSHICEIHFESRFIFTRSNLVGSQNVLRTCLRSSAYPTLYLSSYDAADTQYSDVDLLRYQLMPEVVYNNNLSPDKEISTQDSNVNNLIWHSSSDLFCGSGSFVSYKSLNSTPDASYIKIADNSVISYCSSFNKTPDLSSNRMTENTVIRYGSSFDKSGLSSNIIANNSAIRNKASLHLASSLSSVQLVKSKSKIETTLLSTYEGSLIPKTQQPIQLKTTLQDALKDLSASEHLMLEVKKEFNDYPEELSAKLKTEDVNEEMRNSEELTDSLVYQEIKNHANYYTSFIPKFWKIYNLLQENNEILEFCKKTIDKENSESSLVIREKNITLFKDGTANFSVAGQILNSHGIFFTMKITSVEALLQMILQFDSAKICQGISKNEFNIDKENAIYEDKLGFFRHNFCSLISESQQCDFCKTYN